MIRSSLAIALAVTAMPTLAGAAEMLPGPFDASYVSAYDADTMRLNVHIWLGQTVNVQVRLRGVDAPEIRGACDFEKGLAIVAREFMRSALAEARVVRIIDIEEDKYGGRVVADVYADGISAAKLLLEAGLARPYDGRGAREGWCGGIKSGVQQ